eukprot:5072760-Pyramimonas_sp.AAC.1
MFRDYLASKQFVSRFQKSWPMDITEDDVVNYVQRVCTLKKFSAAPGISSDVKESLEPWLTPVIAWRDGVYMDMRRYW